MVAAPARRVGSPCRASPQDRDENPNRAGGFASPPCFMHELGPAWLGLGPDRAGDSDGPESGDEGRNADEADVTPPDTNRAGR